MNKMVTKMSIVGTVLGRVLGGAMALALFGMAPQAAASIVFTLDCYNDGGACVPATDPAVWGTVVIKDSTDDASITAGEVVIEVDLVGDHLLGLKDLYLNFDPTSSVTAFSVSAATAWDGSAIDTTTIAVNYDPDAQTLNPFNFNLDLCFAGNSNCGGDIGGLDPFSITLGADIDLTAGLFNFSTMDTAGQTVYALAHLQDCTVDQVGCVGGSIKVGATTSTSGGQASNGGPLPEPSSVALIGVGLLGAAFGYRRRTKKTTGTAK